MRCRLRGYPVSLTSKRASGGVTLEAEGEDQRTLKQAGVGRPVGRVAYFASLHARAGMFERKRSALIGVATETRLLAVQAGVRHAGPVSHTPGRGGSAVGVVAISAFHEAFIDTMLGGHGELSADTGMASEAKLRLWLGEECFRSLRAVDRVTTRTGNIGLGVARAAHFAQGKVLGMASETGIERLTGAY